MRLLVLAILLPVFAASRTIHGDINSNEIREDECHLPEALKQEIRSYEAVANTIIYSLVNGKYKVGTGSPNKAKTEFKKAPFRVALIKSWPNLWTPLVLEFQARIIWKMLLIMPWIS